LTETTKQRLLKQAAQALGKEELAARLKVPVSTLEAWIGGHAMMPDRKLITLADVMDKVAAEKK
jgi:DNA-binding transcriptional regulator YiaG